MPERSPAIALFVASGLLIAACGTPGPTPGGRLTDSQRTARQHLIKNNRQLNDIQLAHLCPALYPKDVFTNLKKYGFSSQKATPVKFSSAQLTAAAAARCSAPVAFTTARKTTNHSKN